MYSLVPLCTPWCTLAFVAEKEHAVNRVIKPALCVYVAQNLKITRFGLFRARRPMPMPNRISAGACGERLRAHRGHRHGGYSCRSGQNSTVAGARREKNSMYQARHAPKVACALKDSRWSFYRLRLAFNRFVDVGATMNALSEANSGIVNNRFFVADNIRCAAFHQTRCRPRTALSWIRRGDGPC